MAKKLNLKDNNLKLIPRLILIGCYLLVFLLILIIGVAAPETIFARCSSLVGRTSYAGVDFLNILERILGTLYFYSIFIGVESIVRLIVDISVRNANNKVRTICRLIASAFKYACCLAWLFIALTLWGVNMQTILVSAGIIALVIGLGAQSLISDIIAGINIVFEGEYHVGDVVFIDGFRGTIEEIGLTLTKLIDVSGNRKCINNSKISTVVNLSNESSLAIVDFSIEYSEDLRKVEQIFEEHKEEIRKNIPCLLETPRYLGVNNLGASSVDLRYVANVKEDDRFAAQRALTRELYLLFKDHGVYVPYNQLVLSARHDDETVTQDKIDDIVNQ